MYNVLMGGHYLLVLTNALQLNLSLAVIKVPVYANDIMRAKQLLLGFQIF